MYDCDLKLRKLVEIKKVYCTGLVRESFGIVAIVILSD